MASEIRVNKINSRTGVGTITLSPTGVDFTGIATVATLKATTGIVTTLSATGDVDIADKIVHTGDTNTAIRFPAADTFTVETSGSERLRVASNGKIGIGNTTSPTADLEVAGTTGTASTIFVNAPTHSASIVSQSVLKFGYAHSGSPNAEAEIKLIEDSANSFNGNLTFGVPSNNGSGGSSTSEALRIKSNGNIGIGTDNPSHKLDVRNGSNGVIVARQTTNNGGLNIYEGDDSSGNTKFYVSHNGRVGASEGIIFGSDTAAVNVLDDYEEGSWTPGIAFGGNAVGVTYAVAQGFYTKIGKVVHCNGNMTLSNAGSSTGGVTLTGLPFTVDDNMPNTSLEGGGLFMFQNGMSGTTYGPITILGNNGATTASVYRASATNGEMAGVSKSNIDNDFDCRFMITYYV